MDRIRNAFSHGKAVIAFLTAGDPTVEDSVRYVKTLEAAGADLVEIGVPFSDPIADGPVIMEADVRALARHVHLPEAMEEARAIRKESEIPLVFLTYYNPIFAYGVERFFQDAAAIGIDGVIIPDLPLEEQGEAAPFAEKSGVALIQLVAPTSKERASAIAEKAQGFVYIVSSEGVTGMRDGFGSGLQETIAAVREVTDVPCAVGFGIHTPEQARYMARLADGVITGSAVVDLIAKGGGAADEALGAYIRSLKEAVAAL